MLAGEMWGSGIDHDEGGERVVLGIAGHKGDEGCVVTQVFPGFPAAGAGIETGDIIVAVDGSEVDSFLELTRLVLAKEPGDKIHLKVLRDKKAMEFDVTLSGIENPLPGSVDPQQKSAEDEP